MMINNSVSTILDAFMGSMPLQLITYIELGKEKIRTERVRTTE
jgi:hypothetical protein